MVEGTLRRRWLHLDTGILLAIAGLMLWIGWRRWTHVVIDFGRELYVPWQLAGGQTLYRDIAYFNGPLSPYLNAAVFRIFGAGLTTLILFNLLLLGLTTWVLYRSLRREADRLTAVVGCALFLAVFALADLVGFGNYNFVTPYSHEMTHGTLLGLLLLLILGGWLETPSRGRLGAVGVLLGLVFLTKAEFFVAGVAAVAGGLWAAARQQRSRSPLGRQLGDLTLGFLVVPLATFLLLLTRMPAAAALRGALGPWPYVFLDRLTDLVFYRQGLGTDDPLDSLRRIGVWLVLYALLFAPAWLGARRLTAASPHRRALTFAGGLWVALMLIPVAPRFEMTDLPRPLPVLLAAAVLYGIWIRLRSAGAGGTGDWRDSASLARQIFALVLLAKMALNTRFQNYGFALAMPAAMILVDGLLYRIPRRIEHRGGHGPAFRVAGLVFLVLVGLAFTWPSVLVYQQKNTIFGHGGDRLRVQDRYRVVARLLERLPAHLGPGDSLLVLPEGVMLNFQLRVRNPTPHINFMPPEMIMFGEQAIITALEANPPDVIALLKRRTIEYGFETIGEGYGEELMRWVGARYPVAETIEDPELYGNNFGVALVLRRAR